MIETILKINEKLNQIVWGIPTIILLIGAGIGISIITGFLQFTKFKRIMEETFGKMFTAPKGKEGDITPFQALTVAMGGTVGVGNIAGVATAIALGGPGALFWMLISGILGMATKFGEVVLSINYRIREKEGPMVGGPMVYIERGMGKKFKFLGIIFALFGAIAAFGIGNMVQANSVAEGASHFGIPKFLTGIVLIIAVGLVTIGGIKRIAQVATFFVPFMCITYMICAILVILKHFYNIPEAIKIIFIHAFKPVAPIGGFLGASVSSAIKYGIARGVFSNEAGLGSAPVAHSTAKTDHPVRQGFWGCFEVFFDTIVMCFITGLAIITSGVWITGKTGATLTSEAFSKLFGFNLGNAIVTISMILTAYDTNLAWCFYGETYLSYLVGYKHIARMIYRIIWLPFILLGSLGKLEAVWSIADTLNGLMAIPNIIALFYLLPVIRKLYIEFFQKFD